MSVAIGIDLGTTNTVVAAVVDGVAVTLEDEQGRRLLPSIVSFHPSETVLVGEPARERRLMDPQNTIYSSKPLLGRPFDSDEVRAAIGRFPFRIVEGAKGSTMIIAREVAYALPEISAFVLRRAKAIAEAALGQPVDRAVITVPANFNDLQRASTKIAGKLAGLEVMRILNEPTAAALAYGQSIAKAEKIAVYDLGGGTFDVTLLDLTGNVFEVLATSGDSALGGDDLDQLIAGRFALDIIKRFNFDARMDPVAFGRLRFLAEEMKMELSSTFQAQREIREIGYGAGGAAISATLTLTRQELEHVALPLVERTVAVARQSIEIIGMTPKDFDRVILVGGSTRMPLVARMVEQLFMQTPNLRVNPDEVVALGAAIQAHALNRSKAAHKKRPREDVPAAAAAPSGGAGDPASGFASTTLAMAKAPALPSGIAVPPPPQFFDFAKAPATISFSGVPPAPNAASPAPAPPSAPRVQVTQPMQVPLAPPRPQATATAQMPSAPNLAPRPMQATKPGMAPMPMPPLPPPPPMSFELSEPSVAPLANARPGGPPPAAATQGSAPHGSMDADLDWGMPPPGTPAAGPAAPLELDMGSPPVGGRDLGAIVAEGGFFPQFGDTSNDAPIATDEAYARGSAIETAQAAPLLIDVTPLSLRVETVGGFSDVLIAANSPVPCEKSRTFLTASDQQTIVIIRVAQGEDSRFVGNTRLGDLELSGLRAAARGEVKILVTFELDADGILNVRAKEKDSAHETKATMRLLGTNTDAAEVNAMAARQAQRVVA